MERLNVAFLDLESVAANAEIKMQCALLKFGFTRYPTEIVEVEQHRPLYRGNAATVRCSTRTP